MNDEIKEIIDKLQRVANRETASRNLLMEMKDKDYQLLLDYITNLQQENERLKEDKRKAIEHIEEIWKSAEGGNIYVITIVGLIRADLLNILQNESDDNEYR